MSRKQEERAQLIRRSLRTVEQLDGVLVLDDGGLWLLTSTASSPADPRKLAGVLTGIFLPSRQGLAWLLGSRDIVRVDVENVSRWHKAVTGLDSRRDIRRLLREGIPALRKLTLEDIRERISAAKTRLERLTGTFESSEAAERCRGAGRGEMQDVHTLVGALPARLHALADWHPDPLQSLLKAGSGADRALLALASTTSEGSVANLAAVLLGMRHESTARDQAGKSGPPESLPQALRPAYRAGRSGPWFGPVLVSLALDAGISLDDLPGRVPESVARRLRVVAERVAILFGPDATLEVLRAMTLRWQESEASTARSRKAISRLKRLVRAAETMSPITLRSALEERVVARVRTLPRLRSTQAQVLTQLFEEWIDVAAVEPRGVGSGRLCQIASGSLALGPTAAVTAMAKAWLEAPPKYDEKLEAIERAQLALSLTHPGMALAAPLWSSTGRIERLRFLAARLDRPKLRALWPKLVSLSEEDLGYLPIGFLQSAPAYLVIRAVDLGVAEQAEDLDISVLERYLQTVAILQTMQLQSLARERWYLELFERGGAPAAALTLAILTRFGKREGIDQRLASLHALGRGFRSHGRCLRVRWRIGTRQRSRRPLLSWPGWPRPSKYQRKL